MEVTKNTSQHETSVPKKMEFQYLCKITKQFSKDRILGGGGFGTVYKGEKENGKVVAVKKLKYMEGMNDDKFLNELKHVMDICHPNIVRTKGYCYHIERELMCYNGSYIFVDKLYRLLCFEYVCNGGLDKHLADESSGLDWQKRYSIIKGVCKGLHFLHEGRRGEPILHLDLKPANILLDKDMIPKIADFGQSRLFDQGKTRTYTTNLMGSFGYMAPEYIERHVLSKETDIFSLGVIIMEIVSGQRKYPESTTTQEFAEIHEKWKLRLQATSSKAFLEEECRQVKLCIEIGLKCMDRDPKKRPNIRGIIEILCTSENLNSHSVREDGYDVEEQRGEAVHLEWREALDIIALRSPEQSLKGIEIIFLQLVRIVESDNIVPRYIIKDADRLVSYLTVMVKSTFKLILSGAPSSSLVYFVGFYTIQTLTQSFQIKHLAHAVNKATLEHLFQELLIGSIVSKDGKVRDSLNMLIATIRGNVDRTSMFVVLMSLLRPLEPSRWPSCASSMPHAKKNHLYTELVVNYLDAMTKDFARRTGEFDPYHILPSIHNYLQILEMMKIERRDETNGYPLVVVKRVLQQLVENRGPLIKDDLSVIPMDAHRQPIIVDYIDSFLKVSPHREWCEARTILALHSPEESIKGMEILCRQLGQMVHIKSTVPEYIVKDADTLVSHLAVMAEKASILFFSGADLVACKYPLNTLKRTFQIIRLARAVKAGTLENLIRGLLIYMSTSKLQNDMFLALYRTVSKLMQKITENADRASLFRVIINLLIKPSDPSRWPPCVSAVPLAEKNDLFAEMVAENLHAMAKDFFSRIGLFDLDHILQSIFSYFQQLGLEEIERREKINDDPLVVVMKLLKKLVKLRGTLIKDHLTMVPMDVDPHAIIVAYIDSFLKELAADSSDEEEQSEELIPSEWHDAIDIVALCSPDQSIRGMEVLCTGLAHIVYIKGSVPEYVIKDVDRLVSYLAIMVVRTFVLIFDGVNSLSYNYTLCTLTRIFHITHLAYAVEEGTLENIIRELLVVRSCLKMAYHNMLQCGSQLVFLQENATKLMYKILKNAEGTCIIVVLINLLMRPLQHSRWPSCTSSVPLADRTGVYLGLAAKSLHDMAKKLASTIGLIDLDRILKTIHSYLQELEIKEIKRREETGDDPLAAVMKLLKKLVKIRGSLITEHLSMVPVDADCPPIILTVIEVYLEELAVAANSSSDEETNTI